MIDPTITQVRTATIRNAGIERSYKCGSATLRMRFRRHEKISRIVDEA